MSNLHHHHLSVRKEFEKKFGVNFGWGIEHSAGEYGLDVEGWEQILSFLSSSLASQLSEVEKIIEAKRETPPSKDDDSIYPIIVDEKNKLIDDLLLTLRKEMGLIEKFALDKA